MPRKIGIPSIKRGQTFLAMNKFLHTVPDSGKIFDDSVDGRSVYDREKINVISENIGNALYIVNSIKKVPDLCDKEHLTIMSVAIMRAEMDIRDLVSRISIDVEENDANLATLLPDDFCRVSSPEGAILRITLPCLLGGSTPWYTKKKHDNALMALNKSLYVMVKTAISGYLRTHALPNLESQKVLLIFKRYVKTPDANSLRYCDNNNIEAGAITNAISQSVGKSDNYMSMDFFYTSAVDPDERMEATLIFKSDLPRWVPYLEA